MSSIGSHSGNQRPVPHQQAPLAVPIILIFSREYPATILTVPLTDHGAGTFFGCSMVFPITGGSLIASGSFCQNITTHDENVGEFLT